MRGMANIKNRVERLEKAMRGVKNDAGLIIIEPADFSREEDRLKVIINGETCFIGNSEECDRWIDENIEPIDSKIVVIREAGLSD